MSEPVRATAPRHVLVAGGAGFLGSHLCERLLAQGHRVLCVDSYDTGHVGNVAHLLADPAFTLVKHDVCVPLGVTVDWIFNLACPASPVQYQKHPIRTTRTSVVGTLNLLDLASACGARFLLASTSEVYGDPEVHPQPESYRGNVSSIGPRACYDEGKRCAESLCMDFRRERGTDVRIARIFNTYGPRMRDDDGRVVSNFVCQALRGEPITLFGDGGQTRSFCYVDDLVDGLIALMACEDPVDGPVNLGNPQELSMRTLADTVLALTQAASGRVFLALPADDPRRRCPDITRARQLLGWAPRTPLRTGLLRTIEHFRGVLGIPPADEAAAAGADGGRAGAEAVAVEVPTVDAADV